MKGIKLTAVNANGDVNKRALEVAECLRGSLDIKHDEVDSFFLTHIFNERFNIETKCARGVTRGTRCIRSSVSNTLTLPIDNLKVCPFMCMKHRIPVIGESDEYLDEGVIDWINSNKHPVLLNETEYLFGEISLDLDQLQKIEGIEVIES